ncbi:MAG: hypothetical protein JNL43_04815 [Flavobacteriales bacterium]|nr:hypothetical protein [Flavobacteriales bacterium]
MRPSLITLLLALTAQAQAQRLSLDSMRTAYMEWERAPRIEGDTIGIDLLNDLTVMYMMRGMVDSCVSVSDKAMALGERLVEQSKGTPEERGMRIRYAQAMNFGTNIRMAMGDPVRGVELARIALDNATLLDEPDLMRAAMLELSHGFYELGFDSTALVWHARQMELMKEADAESLAGARLYHANILHNMGEHDTAMVILREALRLNDPQVSVINSMEISYALVNIHLHAGDIDSAKYYANIGRRLRADVPGALSFHQWNLAEAQFDLIDNAPQAALRKAVALDSLGRSMDDYSLVGQALRYKAIAEGMVGRPHDALASTYAMESNIRLEYGVERMRKLALAQSEMAHSNELRLRAAEIRERKRDRDMALAGLGAAVLVALLLLGLVLQARRNTTRLRATNLELTTTQDKLVRVEHERATEAVRTRIARDIHDELGGELTRLSLIGDRLRRDAGREDGPMLKDLADGARRVTHLMSDVVWAVDPVADKAQDLLDHVAHTATRLSEGGVARIDLDLVAEDPAQVLGPELKRDLHLVTKEAVNNAIKYAKASLIEVKLHVRKDGFSWSVKDNGIGLQDNGRQGHGMGNMRARMARLGGELSTHSAEGGGTCVEANGEFTAVPA